MLVPDDIRLLLDTEARAMNTAAFIDDDPVSFPRRYDDLRDIEIVALTVSSIAWGKRSMILRDAERMLALMEYSPYKYVMDGGFDELPAHDNIHRTFFTDNLAHYLRGLRLIYSRFSSLDAFAAHCNIAASPLPAWELARRLNAAFAEANDGRNDSRCLPLNTNDTALKRLNMALRWLVRNDGIVDLGVWKSLTPDRLFIPLDVHVANVSRGLGLLQRRSNDRKAVVELTNVLKSLRPDDPTFYDYALFGLGVTQRAQDLVV